MIGAAIGAVLIVPYGIETGKLRLKLIEAVRVNCTLWN